MPILIQIFKATAWHTTARLAAAAPSEATVAAVRASRLSVRLFDTAADAILCQSLAARGSRERGPRYKVPDQERVLVLATGEDMKSHEPDPYNQQPSRVIVKNPYLTQRFAAW